MRVQSLREGESVDAQLRGERKDQRFYRQDLFSEFSCVDCLMRVHDRDYMITEGSLLGATRGGFFIPWDSDGDFSFDVKDKNGVKNQTAFYEVFTRSNIQANKEKCPMCANMAMAHFTPNYKVDGVEMHCWQTWDDIMSGELLAAKGSEHKKLSKKDHADLLKRIEDVHDTRLFFSDLAEYRDGGGGYLDVEPYFIDEEGKFRNLMLTVDPKLALPPQRYRVAHFTPNADAQANVNVLLEGGGMVGQAGSVQFVELNCPAKPTEMLQHYYGKNWQKVPYNKYDGKKWILDKDPKAPSLSNFLLKNLNF